MEAFEQNILPVSVLQERLQHVSVRKQALDQKKTELSIQLSSSESRGIPPEVVRQLLEKNIQVLQYSSREKKKKLFQLLLSQIQSNKPAVAPEPLIRLKWSLISQKLTFLKHLYLSMYSFLNQIIKIKVTFLSLIQKII